MNTHGGFLFARVCVAAACWASLLGVDAAGQDPHDIRITPLKGVRDVSVTIADARGFDVQQMRISSELRLRQQGLRVKPRGLPVMEVNLHTMETRSGFVVATLGLYVNDLVTFSNGDKGVAVVWRDFKTLYLEKDGSDQKIQQNIDDLVDGLCNDYLAANPPAKGPAR
jgi:hypothetical protein